MTTFFTTDHVIHSKWVQKVESRSWTFFFKSSIYLDCYYSVILCPPGRQRLPKRDCWTLPIYYNLEYCCGQFPLWTNFYSHFSPKLKLISQVKSRCQFILFGFPVFLVGSTFLESQQSSREELCSNFIHKFILQYMVVHTLSFTWTS